MNEAVNRIANTDSKLGKVYDLDTRFNVFVDLLSADIKLNNEAEIWYYIHAYKLLKTTYGEIKKSELDNSFNTKYADKLLKAIIKMDQLVTKQADKDSKINIQYLIDEANILWYSGEYEAAIGVLESAKTINLCEEDVCLVTEMICKIGVDKAFIDSDNTLDVDELLLKCECNTSRKSGQIINDETEDNSVLDGLNLTVVPNPVTEVSQITITGLHENGELVIYNSTGAIVFNEHIVGDSYAYVIHKDRMESGIYLVAVKANGRVVKTSKMVVNK